jgi:hypothetical protein
MWETMKKVHLALNLGAYLVCWRLFRENAKDLRFDALIEKKVICTSPKPDEHHAVQLDPRKGKINLV